VRKDNDDDDDDDDEYDDDIEIVTLERLYSHRAL
jgi:hypothetical protein